jgi:UDP-GlcNAc:undecaprenyl-phosphate/decaprenyl-phosphate GlcNAc-1-phosphate transferase
MSTWFVSVLIAGVALGGALTQVVKKTALRRNWVGQAMPHHFHDGPIPRLGGISIFVTVLILGSATMVFQSAWAVDGWKILSVLSAGLVFFVVGLWDDFSPIPPLLKASLEMLSGVILYFGHIRLESLSPIIHGPLPPVFSFILTVAWVLGITNAFNLIDGLDGLATGSAVISSVSLAVLFTIAGHPGLVVASLILAGALLGFLKFNFSPAAIFLGDCGSLLIGFLMSTLGLLFLKFSTSPAGIIIPLLAFGLPVLDTLLAIVRRIAKKQPIYMPDCEHIHHKLVASGLSAPSSAFALYVVTAFFCLLSVLLVSYPAHDMLLATLPLCPFAACLFGFIYYRYVPELQQLNKSVTPKSDSRNLHVRAKQSPSLVSSRKPSGSESKASQFDEVLAGHRDNQPTRVAFSDD